MHKPTVLFLNTSGGRIARDFNCLPERSREITVCAYMKDLGLCLSGFYGLLGTVRTHLALLHGVAEEGVQQQVLQIAVAVERLFDFPQEDAVG